MKFTISALELRNALSQVTIAVPTKTTLPVLEYIKFDIHEDNLTMTASDLNVTIRSNTKVNVSGTGQNSILLPANKLKNIVSTYDNNEQITVELKEDYEAIIKSSGSKLKLIGLKPEEFLYMPELEYSYDKVIALSGEKLKRIFSRTTIAISKDDYKPSMRGLFLKVSQGKIKAASTDSFRLVEVTEEVESEKELEITIPAKVVEMLKKIESEIVIISVLSEFNEPTHIKIELPDAIIISKLITEKFPDYERLMPQDKPIQTIQVSGDEFISALKRMNLFADLMSKAVHLNISDNTIQLSAKDEHTNSKGEETITCDYVGEPINMVFNAVFLNEIITNIINDTVSIDVISINLYENLAPVIFLPIENNKIISILMKITVGV